MMKHVLEALVLLLVVVHHVGAFQVTAPTRSFATQKNERFSAVSPLQAAKKTMFGASSNKKKVVPKKKVVLPKKKVVPPKKKMITKKTDGTKERIPASKMLLAFLTPWRNPNSIFLYMILIINLLAEVKKH
jgi:hypothetical protein